MADCTPVLADFHPSNTFPGLSLSDTSSIFME
jgi:hypothetical protein